MKLTKKLEAEVLKFYKAYWDSYLNGDMKTLASMLDDNITIFGTAVSEVFNNKKDALKFYKATADQLIDKAQFRNRQINLKAVDDMILINEKCDFYFLLEKKWTYYGLVRVSAVLKQTNKGWKVVQQHASFPDMRADEGEQLAAEKIKEENLQLRDAVKRRTIELEEKNRELEIESAVERVRAKALAMHRSEEISNVVNTLRNELEGLNIPGVAAATITLQQENDNIRLWDITSVVELEDGFHFNMDIIFNLKETRPTDWIRRIWDGTGKYFVYKQDKKSFKRTLAWTSRYNPEFADNARRFIETNNLKNSWHPVVPLSHGKLSLDMLQEPVAEVETILTKMAAAFDLAYKRFLDLKKAEAQTREAKIETALEKVRSRSMGMQKSEELKEVIQIVYEQFVQLNILVEHAGFIIDYKKRDDMNIWLADQHEVPFQVTIPYFDSPHWNSFIEAKEKGKDFFANHLSFKEKNKFYRELFKLFPVPQEAREYYFNCPGLAISTVLLDNVGLYIENFQGIPYTDEENATLMRFGKVFQQTYTRFLDLQKAEAQTRESQIELGLERVRARAMAMQNSDELKELIGTVFTELTKLDLVLTRCVIMIFDPKTKGSTWWIANSEDASNPMGLLVKYHELPPYLAYIKSWRKKKNKFQYILEGKDKKEWDDFLFVETELSQLPDFVIAGMKAPDRVYLSVSFNNFGCLNLASLEPLSDEHFDILLRFAKVFDLTYTRFNDLKLAEAQAREAQIELGLERVRARTMAMQKSDELREAVLVIYEQLQELNFDSKACNIIIIDKETSIAQYWVSGFSQELYPESYTVPYLNHSYHDLLINPWKKGDKYVVYEYTGKMKQSFDEIFFTQTEFRNIPEEAKNVMIGLKSVILSTAFISYGALQSLGAEPLSEENANILQRFAKVFEQTYTRFLDLKKAEAQAREAQIEAALERVRSHTMGMRSSNDLSNVATVMFDQMKLLGGDLFAFGIVLCDKHENMVEQWHSMPGSGMMEPFFVPINLDYIHQYRYDQWKAGVELFSIVIPEDYIGRHFELMLELPSVKAEIEKFVAQGNSFSVPNWEIDYGASFKNGYLLVSSFKPFEEAKIFSRFAKVFEQAYIRFLDLQKAEAQAREAKIEAALERVRARTMAMHKSEELSEAAFVLFQQFKALGEEPERIFIATFDEVEEGVIDLWGTNQGGKQLDKLFKVPANEPTMVSKIIAAWKEKKKSIVIDLSGGELKKYLEFLNKAGIPVTPGLMTERRVQTVGCFSKGVIGITTPEPRPAESVELLERFAGVFNLTYTRFLDLVHAEAQRREAQIEAALERVRSRAMAMHKTDELLEASELIYKELTGLGITSMNVSYAFVDEQEKYGSYYSVNPVDGKTVPFPFVFPHTETKVMLSLLSSWKKQEPFHLIELDEEATLKHQTYIGNHIQKQIAENNPEIPFTVDAFLEVSPKKAMIYNFNFAQGYIFIIGSTRLTTEQENIVLRFTKVFELTYRRFLDLKQAAEQAREAQIELGLERVRARAMAMQKSDELKELINTVSVELGKLDIVLDRCFIITYDIATMGSTWWMSNPETPGESIGLFIKYHEYPPYLAHVEAWKQRKFKWEYILEGETKKTWDQFLFVETELSKLPPFVIENMRSNEKVYLSSSFNNFGYLSLATLEPLTEEQFDIMLRFAKVFDLTYTRFNDLQKAETQAREAQIELSLERVRAKAMAMHHSDELSDVLSILFEQFDVLGIHPMYAQLNLFDLENNKFSFRCTGRAGQRVMAEQVVALDAMENWKDSVANFKKDKPDSVHCHEYPPEAIPQTFDLFKKIRDSIPEEALVHAEDFPDGLFITQGYCKFGYIGFGHNRKATEEEKTIVSKFGTEFGRVYQRFLDLQKAEAQAREAQIEAALERIRAVSMAIRKSNELFDIIHTVFGEWKKLGFELYECNINLLDRTKKEWTNWGTGIGDAKLPRSFLFPWFDDPFVNQLYDDTNSGISHRTYLLEGKDHHRFLDGMFTNTDFKNAPQEYRNELYNISRLYLTHAFMQYGSMDIVGPEPPPEQTIDILKRFAKVFEQAYTRYLDVVQAEAQAREAQIEVGLERVRSKAMAMHKSDDLKFAVATVFEELDKLNLGLLRCGIAILDKEKARSDIWITIKSEKGSTIQVSGGEPLDIHPLLQGAYDAWLKQEDFYYVLQDDDLLSYYHAINKTNFQQPISASFTPDKKEQRQYFFNAVFQDGSLFAFLDTDFTDEAKAVMKRFANVFNLTYKRFLDLQKAEAQAREAEIQLALERVRARSMAMHKSDELADLSLELVKQVQALGVATWFCAFNIYDDDRGCSLEWGSNGEGTFPQYRTPREGIFLRYYEAGQRGETFLLNEIGEKECPAHYEYLCSLPGVGEQLLKMKEAGVAFPTSQIDHVVYFKYGYLLFITFEPAHEAHDIFKRFAAVFEQTYTRFLDLQKAEAQARESQIQLALERVRARTMAMQKSDELPETSHILFEQMKELGEPVEQLSIGVVHEENNVIEISATLHGDTLKKIYQHSIDEPFMMNKIYHAWKTQQKTLIIELKSEELNAYNKYRNELTKSEMFPTNLGDEHRRIVYAAFFSKGMLALGSNEPRPPESLHLLERFAGVFDQTYTRFLDLQKAEAQAREAQIESALEKVRSRSLAMHKSDELQEVVNTVFERLQELKVEMDSCNIAIFKEGTRDFEFWIASPFQKRTASFRIAGDWNFRIIQNLLAARESGKDFFSECFSFEEKNKWFEFAFNNTDFMLLSPDRQKYILEREAYALSIAFSKNTGVQINNYSGNPPSEKEKEILSRFSKVFEQAYIRFLDLEKAEAQAREAQIEAALERVRAAAMAMHKSDDLHGAVAIMFEEFQKLNLSVLRCGIGILNTDSRTGTVWVTSVSENGFAIQSSANESFDTNPLMGLIYEHWKKQEDLDYILKGQDLINYYRAMDASGLKLPKSQLFFSQDESQYYYAAMFKAGGLYAFRDSPFAEEDKKIMKRFAAVVNLTYNRFLDLQKAEANAREAQIEASLERVRSRTMAMHKSEELPGAATLLFNQLQILGMPAFAAGYCIWDEDKQAITLWMSSEGVLQPPFRAPTTEDELFIQMRKGFEEGKALHVVEMGGEELVAHYQYMRTLPVVGSIFDSILKAGHQLPAYQVMHYAYFSKGFLLIITYEPVPDAHSIFKRFSSVFDQTYTRFLDLQKAEAQAREAQIEASLERVRAKAMAMHSSKDLTESLTVFYRELRSLGVTPRRCGIALMDKEERLAEVTTMNTTEQGDSIEVIGHIKMSGHKILDDVYKNWLLQKEYHAVLRGNEIKEYYQVLKPQMDFPDYPNDVAQFGYYFMFNEGDVYAWTEKELTEDELKIYRRFTTVISLTYKRYKDLQQAESQAREAQIEAGLERVRARTMAMHSSDDVSAATATMFTELEKLGIQNLRGGITIIKPDQIQEVWSITNLPDGSTIRSIGVFDMRLHPFWQAIFKAKERKDDYLYYWLAGEDKENYIAILNATPNYLAQPIKEMQDVHVQCYFFSEGGVWTNSLQPHSEEDKLIMKRFTSVFSLTFRRYQDLKKAEAQAREATIEAALEKVRGKAMAMHNSNDLTATASMVFSELRKLGINSIRSGVGLLSKESRKVTLYSATTSEQGDSLSLVGWALLTDHPVLAEIYDSWIRNEDYFPVLRGEILKSYYAQIRSNFIVPKEQADYEQYGYFLQFSEGMFYGWSEQPYTNMEIKILKRFASVIDLTFRRYMELQKSEASAREAVKQAALDRIRADIASMRSVSDLDRITPLIWNELTILGIPFIRCGVFIMDEDQQLIHTFLSTPDGKAIAAFHLPYDTPGNISKVIEGWHYKKIYIDHWGEEEFIQFADILMKQGALISRENYLKTIPHGGFHLHFLPFLQGMLYVGNTEKLNDEQIELIQHVADAFSTAYARYEDFTRLEAAKKQVENTLTDLKQAQQQLVQSEKMASLGELTAGIAHEIQNPLNFVNNFSDVSNELLEEMKNELEKGNKEDAIAIVEDVKQNLEKILHHGKRADAIVKGMLQHSRTSSGQKEPTDINMLADEYLRLAFHGLRAKDKSFNAKFETSFDTSIEKINIIPQEIGRVILNLINNAFYAVTEKRKHIEKVRPDNPVGKGYEPSVFVTTKRENGKVEIKVRDNGNGIPQKNLDKIFQPFFTTKPTGQGTGLGLSLAYDIITKGHGGELKVETREGEGSEFIIQLPSS